MKVLIINSVCGIRSTGKICTDLAQILMDNGHTVKIAYGREKAPERFEKISYRIGNGFGIKLHAFFSRLFDSAGKHS